MASATAHSKVVVSLIQLDSLFIVASIVCVFPLFGPCFSVLSSFVIILLRKRELVTLL